MKTVSKLNKLIFSLLLLLNLNAFCQPTSYSVANAHSHNDYEQPVPLYTAYHEAFGSIEADIFWHNGELLVAHTARELALHRTLEDLYLKPLQAFVEKNNGHIYADSTRRLQFMIDIKTDGVTTLNKLVELLQKYPSLTQCATLQIAISGNRPDIAAYTSYPAFIGFDGDLNKDYPAAALSRIVMLSADFKKYTLWNGKGIVPAPQWDTLQRLVTRAHALRKPVRFWATPDFTNAWYQLIRLQVDYINTDSIKALADFLRKLPASSWKNKTTYKPYQPDADGQILVIVTADHETGGLSSLAGEYTDGYVSGSFATNDHTAIPVPVFAYGQQSFRFRGVYENTELFYRIMEALKIPVRNTEVGSKK